MTDCSDWIAWHNWKPHGPPSLHVSGRCSFPRDGFTVDLERIEPADVTTPPQIAGPHVVVRSGPAPVFRVAVAPGWYYAAEVAGRRELLDAAGSSNRNDSNYYASWQETGALRSDPAYQLPADVWTRLKHFDRLFYRLWLSASHGAWTNQFAVPAAGAIAVAPFIEVVDSNAMSVPRQILALSMTVHAPAANAGINPTMVDVSYREETRVEYDLAVILPNRTTIPIEDVY